MKGKKLLILIAIVAVIGIVYFGLTFMLRDGTLASEKAVEEFYKSTLEQQKQQIEKRESDYKNRLKELQSSGVPETEIKYANKTYNIVTEALDPQMLENMAWFKNKNDQLPSIGNSWNFFEVYGKHHRRTGLLITYGTFIAAHGIATYDIFKKTGEFEEAPDLISPEIFSGQISKAEKVNLDSLNFREYYYSKSGPLSESHAGRPKPFLESKELTCEESEKYLKEYLVQMKEKFENSEPNTYQKAYYASVILSFEKLGKID